MFRKNVAGQFIHFQGVDSSTGGIKSGVTWTVRRCIDGTFAAGGGTVTEDGTTGFYKYAMSQADTNGNNIGFNFVGTGAVPQTVNIITDGSPPDVNTAKIGGQTASASGTVTFPNATLASTTNITSASGVALAADQAVNTTKLGGTTVTGRDIGASVLLSSGTGTGQLDFTSGIVKSNLSQILGTALTETAGQIAAAFKKFFDKASPTGTINSLPDAVPDASGGLPVTGTRLTAIPTLPAALVGGRIDASVGAYQSAQAPLQPTVAGRTLDVSAGGEAGVDWANVGSPSTTVGLSGTTVKTATDVETDTQDIQSRIPSALDANGFIKSDVEDWKGSTAPAMTGDSFARLGAPAGASVSADIAAVKSDTGAIKTKTDNLPVDPANASDVAGAFSTVNGTLATIAGYIDTEVGAIKAKTDNLPASPAATGDIPAASEIADTVLALLTSSSFAFPTTAVLDDFNRADEGPPPSSNWTTGIANGFGGFLEPGHEVISNQMANTFQDVTQNYWNVEEFGPDSEAYITVTDSQGIISVGLAARLTDIGRFTCEGYAVLAQPSATVNRNYSIYRIDNGVITSLASTTESGVGSMTGDKYGIRCIGNNIQLWGDTGSGWELKLSAVDSTYRGAGAIGVYTESDPLARWDNFGGGDIVFPVDLPLLLNSNAIANAVWDEDIVSKHQTDDTAGKKLSKALILYEGS